MRAAPIACALALVTACKSKHDDARAVAAGSGSAAVVSGDAGPADAAAGPSALTFATPSEDDDKTLGVAFHGRVPDLPALAADTTVIATFDALGGGPMTPQPMQLALAKFPSGESIENLPILDEKEGIAAEQAGSAWLTPDLQRRIEQRGAAALARLHGFRSLVRVEVAVNSNGDPKPTKIGDATLVANTDAKERLTVSLRDASGRVLHREQIAPYTGDTTQVAGGEMACQYRPSLGRLYRDPATSTLVVEIGFRFHEECETSRPRYLVWPLADAAAATAAPADALREVVTKQLDTVGVNSLDRSDVFTPDATVISANLITTRDDLKLIGVADKAMDYSGHDDKDVMITLSRDGKSAWASELASVTLLEPNTPGSDHAWRVSDVLVQTPKGWRIAAAAWTEPRANASVNRDAKAGKLTAEKLDSPSGDPNLGAAFAKLTTEGVDASAAARADLVAIGSGPGERTVGGASFAKAWNAAWKGKLTIISSVARTLPSGTTGWVAATVTLAKAGYTIPFTVFCVFDKAAGGTWSLVHIHFAV